MYTCLCLNNRSPVGPSETGTGEEEISKTLNGQRKGESGMLRVLADGQKKGITKTI